MNYKNIYPTNMGEQRCEWRDSNGDCPKGCQHEEKCFPLISSEQEEIEEKISKKFGKPEKEKVFQKCKKCNQSRNSYKKGFVYYCLKTKTHHLGKGGCYTRKQEVQQKKKSWTDDYENY